MHKRQAFCELFSRRARAPRPLAAFLGLLLAGLSASVALGQELDWAKRVGGTERDDGRDIAVGGAGNSYVIGNFGGTATFGPGETNQTILTSAGDVDVFVAKYDSAGALVWAKRAGGTDWENGNGIAVDAAGNSFVTGYFGSTATFGPGEANQTILTGSGIFVAKYDSAGVLVWAKQAGGTGTHYEAHITVDEAGNSYVTGAFVGMATFGPGEANEIILTASAFDIFVQVRQGRRAGVGKAGRRDRR
jgi:Beta-propeller repeat